MDSWRIPPHALCPGRCRPCARLCVFLFDFTLPWMCLRQCLASTEVNSFTEEWSSKGKGKGSWTLSTALAAGPNMVLGHYILLCPLSLTEGICLGLRKHARPCNCNRNVMWYTNCSVTGVYTVHTGRLPLGLSTFSTNQYSTLHCRQYSTVLYIR